MVKDYQLVHNLHYLLVLATKYRQKVITDTYYPYYNHRGMINT